MIWIVAIIAAGLCLCVVLMIAARRRLVARLGFSYATQRMRWTALIVAGLTISTGVIAAVGIASDSMGESYLRSLTEQSGRVDGAVDATRAGLDPEGPLGAAGAGRLVDHPSLAPFVADHTASLRLQREVGATTLAGKEMAVWGIDPASYARVTKWRADEGRLPETLQGWAPDGFVLNEQAAAGQGLFVGDPVHLVLDRTIDSRVWFERAEEWTFDGHFQLVAYNPVLFHEYVHSSENTHVFVFDIEQEYQPDASLYVNATASEDIDLHLELVGPGGGSFSEFSDGPEARIRYPVVLPGQWTATLHSPLAVDVDLQVDVTVVRPNYETVPIVEVHSGQVQAIVPTRGSDPLKAGPAVFLPLPTLQGLVDRDGLVNVVLVTAHEGTDPEAFKTAIDAANRGAWGGIGRVIVPAADERAEVISANTQRFLFILSTFTLISGVLLVFVIMTLLVEDRKRVIAVMRAVGAQPKDITRMHVSEGTVYAILAAVAGIPFGIFVVLVLSGLLATEFIGEGSGMVLSLRPVTLIGALSAGFLFAVIPIFFAARRVGRLAIPYALRGEEPERLPRSWLGTARAGLMTLVGGLGALVGFAANWPAFAFLGMVFLIVGASWSVSQVLGRSPFVVATAATVFIVTLLFIPAISMEENRTALLLPLVTLAISMSAAVLLVYARWVHRFVVWAAAKARLAPALVEAALSHLRGRPGRFALIMGVLASVLLVTTIFAGLYGAMESPTLGDAGGFTVLGKTHAQLEDPYDHLASYPPRGGFDPVARADGIVATPWSSHQDIVGVTPDFIDEARFREAELQAGHSSVQDAFRAVLRDPGLVVAADHVRLAPGGTLDRVNGQAPKVGDRIELQGWADLGVPERELRVVAVLVGSGAAALYVHPDVTTEHGRNTGTILWARPAPGVSDQTLSTELAGGFRSVALEAIQVMDPDPSGQAQARNLQSLLGTYLGLGVVIGVIGIGLLTVRSVLVRRREIGTMRAMGATPRQIVTIFAFESLYVTLAALAVGIVGAGLVAQALLRDMPGLVVWRLDWAILAPFYGATVLAALTMTWIAARQAARMNPVDALRHAE